MADLSIDPDEEDDDVDDDGVILGLATPSGGADVATKPDSATSTRLPAAIQYIPREQSKWLLSWKIIACHVGS